MKVEVKKDEEKSETEVVIEVSGDELKPYFERAAKKLSRKHDIKGFRPGKAPPRVVEETVGLARVLNVVADEAVPHFFVKAVLEHEVEALARPSIAIDSISRERGVKFKAKVSVLPRVKLGDLNEIKGEKKKIIVKDEDVEKKLKNLAKKRSSYLEVARPAKKGDAVKVDFKLSRKGTPLENGTGKGQLINLGDGYFVQDFEDKLVGIKAGDTREFKVKFPDDYKRGGLGGAEVEAWVRAEAVQKRVLPKIDDEFAQQLGKFESLDDLKRKMRDNLKHEREYKERERYQAEMVRQLAAGADFAVIPAILINKEIDRLLEEFSQMLSPQQRSLEDYLRQNNRTIEQVREEMRPNAEQNVKVGLALREFARQEGITVAKEEVDEKAWQYLTRFSSPREAEEKVNIQELKENLGYMLRNQRAIEALEKKIKEIPGTN